MDNKYRTRMAIANFERWLNSTAYGLDYVYDRYSHNKAVAWRYCEDLCNKYHGYGLKVISYNTFQFTCGFSYIDDNGTQMFMYITPSYDVAIESPIYK